MLVWKGIVVWESEEAGTDDAGCELRLGGVEEIKL